MYKVLYVEDDNLSRSVMQLVERLNPNRISITTIVDSNDFETTISRFQDRFDLILLDIHVKPLDGFEMLKIIRQNSAFDEIPVIALTASVMNEEVRFLRQADFDGALAKPIDLDGFMDLVERIVIGEKIWHMQ